jgi:hypothetical protein
MTRTRLTPCSSSQLRKASTLTARDPTSAFAMPSASGFQRSRLVSARTAGKAFRRDWMSGAITGNTETPDSRQRRAVTIQVTGVPASASKKRAIARSFSWLSRTTSIGPAACR